VLTRNVLLTALNDLSPRQRACVVLRYYQDLVLDEHELRERLAAAADLTSAPRFTADDLTGRIRLLRAKIAGLVSGLLLAGPVALTGPGTAPESRPSVVPFQLSFTVVVNGRARAFPRHGMPPSLSSPRANT
jgi:hypothetical protein